MTREELDARAAELGISTSPRWKDETVAEKIAEAEAEAEQTATDTTPEGTSDGPGPVQGAGEGAAPIKSSDPEQPPEGVLTVIGPRKGRWRAGRHFSPESVKIPLAELSDDEIAMLAGDPKLTLSGLPQD
ncbi:hypothetical protein PVW46_14880 [Mameliella sp. AT18]|uniref:hypothetical protein n=1 Tax=Mameliella sp. AT18 TaxID=3028385 RepID=UPI00237C32D3|nr:hypothetical protein [Mameliella sp. AT18]MDD9731198.1 hypothetical protein [Mameliella sp. AT18]